MIPRRGNVQIYFARVERGVSVAEVVFAVQPPRSLVEEYVRLIVEFSLGRAEVYGRCAPGMLEREPPLEEEPSGAASLAPPRGSNDDGVLS